MTVLVERFFRMFPDAQQLYPIRSDTDGAIVHKDPESGQYMVSEMRAYPDINSTVYSLWVLSTDELVELMLDFIRTVS